MKSVFRVAVICALGLGVCQAGRAQKKQDEMKNLQDDVATLKKDVKDLGDKQQQALDQLAEIKKLLQANAAPTPPPLQTPDPFNVQGLPVQGDPTARVAIVEFTDFQCPFCGMFMSQTYPKILEDYIKAGKVKFFFRDFPLSFHGDALLAARAAHCAGEQGKFWEMHNSLFANQNAIAKKDLLDRAPKLGLDAGLFNQCLSSDRYSNDIDASVQAAEKLGVSGTPTFLIGPLDADGITVHVKKGFAGAYPFEAFKSALDPLLAAPKAPDTKPGQ